MKLSLPYPLPDLPTQSRQVLLAVSALAAALVFFVYAGPGAAYRAQATAIQALADQVRTDDADLARRLREPERQSVHAADPLRQLNAAVENSGVALLRLLPRSGKPALFDIELEANFSALVRFAAAIEASGGMLRNLQLRPKEGVADRLLAGLEVTIGAGSSNATMANNVPHRDPFALPAARIAHRLTGITRVGDHWMATVDDHDYVQGDRLDEALVVSVGVQGVTLSASGVETVLRLPGSLPPRSRLTDK